MSLCVCVCVFFIFAYVYACVCVCVRGMLTHTEPRASYASLSALIRPFEPMLLPLPASPSASASTATSFFFLLCHFDWKIARNWKFLLLAVRSIHSLTHTHSQPGTHTHTHRECGSCESAVSARARSFYGKSIRKKKEKKKKKNGNRRTVKQTQNCDATALLLLQLAALLSLAL